MNSVIYRTILLMLLIGCAANVSAHVVLDYPQGGETFSSGETITIQWHIAIPHNTLNWDLLFSDDGGMTWEALQMDVPAGELNYLWIVPEGTTSLARVSVIQDNEGANYQDESGDFTITSGALPPMIQIPAMDTTITCNEGNQDLAIQLWLDHHGGASVMNFCNDIVWTNDYNTLNKDCGQSGTATVKFTATDECGSTETSATLMVIDEQPPVWLAEPLDMIVECDGNGNIQELTNWINSYGGAMAADDCSDIIWQAVAGNQDTLCGASRIINYLFTATDECGNSVSAAASFTIMDSSSPVIMLPALDTTIECGLPNQDLIIQHWLDSHGGAMAGDVCGNVLWTHNLDNLPGDTCETSANFEVTFTASDDCGNTSQTTAALNILGASATFDQGLTVFRFSIFPNPANDIVYIKIERGESLRHYFSLVDLFGNEIWRSNKNNQTWQIFVDNFFPGIYFIRANTQEGVIIQKIIIE